MDERRKGCGSLEESTRTGTGADICLSEARLKRQRKVVKRERGSRSEGSRDERKSRKEGCGGALFTGQGHKVYCDFVRQQL